MTDLMTRAQAKAGGFTHYFTGKPCVRGHVAVRFTSIGKCKICAREDAMRGFVPKTSSRRVVRDTPTFIKKSQELHGEAYTYEQSVFVSAKTPIVVTCPTHGDFTVRPDNHTHGKGCPLCAVARHPQYAPKSTAQFIADARRVWGDRCDYSAVSYVQAKVPVSIRCVEHDVRFLQRPTNHLSGRVGCPRCNHMKSAPEEAVASLCELFTPVVRRDRVLVKPNELDIFMPEKRLAVEYCGEYWHSSGDADSEVSMSTKHSSKYRQCAASGVRLLTIYETEWKEHNYAIRRLLRNAVGASRGKLMARKCDLRKVGTKDATVFYDRYHPQGGAGSGEHYGLYWGDKLAACMRFTLGANDRGNAKARVWTLTRYATRITVSGGASRLFSAFVKDFNPKEIKSFSDNRYFSGGMYEQLGFVMVGESPADYQVWHPKLGLKPKSHWQRRALLKIAAGLALPLEFDHETDPRTERDITYLLGGRRLYDCGKKKWVWTSER